MSTLTPEQKFEAVVSSYSGWSYDDCERPSNPKKFKHFMATRRNAHSRPAALDRIWENLRSLANTYLRHKPRDEDTADMYIAQADRMLRLNGIKGAMRREFMVFAFGAARAYSDDWGQLGANERAYYSIIRDVLKEHDHHTQGEEACLKLDTLETNLVCHEADDDTYENISFFVEGLKGIYRCRAPMCECMKTGCLTCAKLRKEFEEAYGIDPNAFVIPGTGYLAGYTAPK
jgi:hypothetical protein